MEQSIAKSLEAKNSNNNRGPNSKQDKKILFSKLKVKDETIKENLKEESEDDENGGEIDIEKQRREIHANRVSRVLLMY